MVKFCPRHRLGFNNDFDPVCPQCTLAHLDAPTPWVVDQTTLDVTIPALEADKTPINLRTRK